MQQKEREIEKECAKIARKRGWVAWKNEKNGNKGIPDHSFLHPDGTFFMVEFKKDDKQQLRSEQKIWLERFNKSIFVCSSVDDFLQIIDSIHKKL